MGRGTPSDRQAAWGPGRHEIEADESAARVGHECFDQLQRIEHEMRRAIASGMGKLVHQLALRAVRQSFTGQGRTQQGATAHTSDKDEACALAGIAAAGLVGDTG